MRRLTIQRRLHSSLLSRVPGVTSHVTGFTNSDKFDKCFASEWYDRNNVLLGTKCNKLLLLDLIRNAYKTIELPAPAPRSFSTTNNGWGNCGKHCIGFNNSRTLFATGGTDPADTVVIDSSTLETKVSLVGHRDWMFGLAWVTDCHLVTGSRDCSLAMWDISPCYNDYDSYPFVIHSKDVTIGEEYQEESGGDFVKIDFSSRVREVKFSAETSTLAVLTSDASIKLLDPRREMAKIRSFYLPNSLEPVCMAYDCNKVAVGCLDRVDMIDIRVRTVRNNLITYNSPDSHSGVRSVEFNNHVLSFGTGKGSLVFHDIRMHTHALISNCHHLAQSSSTNMSDSSSCCTVLENPLQGWHENSNGFYNNKHAIYSHKWDPSATKIFFCGGPLTYGSKGHVCGLWE
jgi:WD repeat-containing protein 40A